MVVRHTNKFLAAMSSSRSDNVTKFFRLFFRPLFFLLCFWSLEVVFVSRKFQGCFKEVSRVFQVSFKEVLRMFRESFKGVLRKFQGCFKEVSRVFQGSFKGVSRKF